MKKTIALLGLLLINGQAIADKIDTRLEAIADDFVNTRNSEDCCDDIVKICFKQQAFLRKYAHQNYPKAQYILSECYEHEGKGNMAQKFEWLRKAAEKNYALAQYYLALDFYDSDYEKSRKDAAQALKWYKKSAENGYGEAQYHLGQMYENGAEGIKQDVIQAVKWYRKAAIQKDEHELYARWAQRELGKIYEEGKGEVKQDKVQAIEWYRKAGETSAVERLTRTAQ